MFLLQMANTSAVVIFPKRLFSRSLRKGVLFLAYAGIFAFSLMLAFEFPDSFQITETATKQISDSLFWVIGLKLLSLTFFRQFRPLLSYFRLPDVYRLANALAIPSGAFLAASFYSNYGLLESKSTILLDYFFSLSLLSMFRTTLRIHSESKEGDAPFGTNTEKQLVAIYGAGETGSALVAHLMGKHGRPLKPVLFLDDDGKWHKRVHGIWVVPPRKGFERICSKCISKLVVAMPSASSAKLYEISEQAQQIGLTVEIVPSWKELVSGKKRVDKPRPVSIEDLFCRDRINLHSKNVFSMLKGKVALVTGAGGTIGSYLVG